MKPNKAIIIGIDAPIVPRLYRYCKEGHLPTISKLFLEQGVWAHNCLAPLPTVTPPNWGAISTGAWPSTIQIMDFDLHVPGDELDKLHQGMSSEDIHAETLYEAIAKAGKKSILINYPSTWPAKVEDSIVIGGADIGLNTWGQRCQRFRGEIPGRGKPSGSPYPDTYSGTTLYSTQEYTETDLGGSSVIKFEEPVDWKNLPASGAAKAAEMPLKYKNCRYKLDPVTWHVLVADGKAMVCESKDAATAFATLAEGEWTPPITREFGTEIGKKKAIFRMKLVELSPDVEKFRLLITNIAAADGWSHPASIAGEIKSEEGVPGPGFHEWSWFRRDWFGLDTVIEIEHMANAFYADTATYLMKNKEWSLYMMHAHAPDAMYHTISNALNDADPVARKPYEEAELAIYKDLDEMCARIFGCADENTVMAIISDHGAKPTTAPINANRILQDGGFATFDENGVVDWSKTRAIASSATHIFINVKGRDPQGIVEPGEEYRSVQEEVINCLHDYTDPVSGKKPYVLALRREDARIIGIHGEWVGDVIIGLSGDFGGQHAPQVPTAQYGIGDLRSLFALSGPNIKKGVELDRTVWIQDLVPTICYLTGWPVPAQTEGAVIYQALEDPNAR